MVKIRQALEQVGLRLQQAKASQIVWQPRLLPINQTLSAPVSRLTLARTRPRSGRAGVAAQIGAGHRVGIPGLVPIGGAQDRLHINTPVLLFDWPGNQGDDLTGYRASRQMATQSAAG
jgi:hypothetical protein